MPQSNLSRGLAWLANRDNQPAVAGLLGWPIVTITINPRSRGCLAGPWFARRDRDNVCAASEVNSPPWVEANRGAMVMAHTRVCVFFLRARALVLARVLGWMDWRLRVLAEKKLLDMAQSSLLITVLLLD